MTEQFYFSNSATIAVNFGINPNNQPDFSANLTGESTILVGAQVDALVDDPILGNVGTVDDNADVTKVELVSSSSTGSTPFVSTITATFGDNVADLSPTPNDTELPFESLYSAGATISDGENNTSEGFLKLFLEIEGTPEGTLRNKDPLTLETSSSLSNSADEKDPEPITYTSSEIIELYTAGEDGVFWTGDEQQVAKLVPDANGNSVKLELTPVAWDQTSDMFALGSAAVDNNNCFIFDNASGSLFFDIDGVGGIEQVKIAQLSPETVLSANNIFVDSNGAV